jgi:hypothetical protein
MPPVARLRPAVRYRVDTRINSAHDEVARFASMLARVGCDPAPRAYFANAASSPEPRTNTYSPKTPCVAFAQLTYCSHQP